ncbi:(2Fe-2S)-binding protein [Streptomyces tirandamycinicus]|uniref:(2Fe-2S)-binding protein n=1 Tax=Streptomyces tirandamycinicus TaxID=2174846 RepID=UPI00226F0099|nr:2Fe-2S iron-sulfur cluster-binding protein [Streptomyces tirandamycinicus]MCY0980085.1 2Fe-2S iron-sulfur cluster-binding protein [Streptomyces tirandamycinicus]
MSSEENESRDTAPHGGGWQPIPQGAEYDAEATAFVHLPSDDMREAPLAAPGHGYVPPQIPSMAQDGQAVDWTVPGQAPDASRHWEAQGAGQPHHHPHHPYEPYAGQRPYAGHEAHPGPGPGPRGDGDSRDGEPHGTYGTQGVYGAPDPHGAGELHGPQEPRGAGEPYAGHGAHPGPAPLGGDSLGGHDTEGGDGPRVSGGAGGGHDPHATGQWTFPEAEEPSSGPAGAAATGDLTGQWTIPVAQGDLPEESGEFSTSALAQWGGRTPPATLPGGAPAPWATTPDGGTPAEGTPLGGTPASGTPVPGAGYPATLPGGAPAPWATEVYPVEVERAGSAAELPTEQPAEAGYGPHGDQAHPHAGEGDAVAPDRGAADRTESGRVEAGHTETDRTGTASTESFASTENTEGTEGTENTGSESTEPARTDGTDGTARTAGTARTESDPTGPAPTESADHTGDLGAAGADAAPGGQYPPDSARQEPPVPARPAAAEAAAGEAAAGEAADPSAADAETAASAPAATANDEHPHTSYVLRVNGADRPVTDAWIGESLLYVLRERLGLAGAKDGCSQGECGACNVQVDGRLVASCLVPAATAAGSEVRTVEGLASDGEPSDVQRALAACGAVQCGFCIPGMAMTVHDLLEGNHAPTELETRQALSGNLCRCSGYRGVLDAVREVAAERGASAAAAAEAGDGSREGPHDGARIPHQAPPGAGSVQPHPHDGGMV